MSSIEYFWEHQREAMKHKAELKAEAKAHKNEKGKKKKKGNKMGSKAESVPVGSKPKTAAQEERKEPAKACPFIIPVEETNKLK